ncbi:MAG TPA: choice-of-anchor D domain-containing protein, partial [Candidatus Acidoferrales bacterium]|nr:choice-of-anchor D domain-containing protein [Candidatus Acidoferrales bacterium]
MSLRTSIRSCLVVLVPIVATFGIPPLLPTPPMAHAQAVFPALPQVFLDTTYTPPTGAPITVPAGGDFQGALNAAQPGTVIVLQAGATYSGNFTLPYKSGTGWIYIQSSALANLPVGSRVSPATAALMPKIVSPNTSPAISTAAGAHNYRLAGIEITTTWASTTTGTAYNIVSLDTGATSLSQVPTDIVFDRCYIHGTPTGNVRRGIAMNSARTAVIDSYLSDFHEVGADAQAVAAWNGPGPFKIVNNELEGAAENILFGGQDPTIANLVPSDIEIRGNHFFKPLTWRVGDPTYAGIHWNVKNLLELKNAQRVLVDGNIFEYNWPDAQNGFAILYTVRNQNGTAPWSIVADVTFTRNIVRHVAAGVYILGRDYNFPSQQVQRVLIQNTLFADVGGTWTFGRMFNIIDGPANVIIDHNDFLQTETVLWVGCNLGCPLGAPGPAISPGFVFTNTITPNNLYGVSGDNLAGNALLTLSTYFPNYVFARNVLPGGNPASYPANNFFPANLAGVGFVNFTGGDYTLAASSPYKNAGTDGKDIGADVNALSAATATALGTGSSTSPTPVLSVTPQATVDFGSIVVGGSADRSFTVANTGGGTLTGTATSAAPFSVVSGGSFGLSGGASQTVVVRFSPTAAGAFAGNVSFTSNGGTASQALTGTGTVVSTPPTLSVAPQAVNLGSVAVGSSATNSFTVTNTGGNTLTGTTSTAAPFSVVSGSSFSLGGGASQTVIVGFSPTVGGTFTGSVIVSSNASSVTVAVTGTATVSTSNNLSVTPQAVNLGSVAVGSSATNSFTV